MAKLVVDKDKCTGCMVCFNCCPKKAIKMEEKNGFYFPKIDEEKCIINQENLDSAEVQGAMEACPTAAISIEE